MKKNIFFTLTVICIVFSHSGLCQTVDNHQDFDKYSVHYSVFNSTFLQPGIAKNYKIKRSKYESIINVSVSHKGKLGALPAQVRGSVKNLMQQQKELNFIEIREKDATYYIAPIRVAGKEILHFEISAVPAGETSVLTTKFTKTLYSD